jgi:hypothetical protein
MTTLELAPHDPDDDVALSFDGQQSAKNSHGHLDDREPYSAG